MRNSDAAAVDSDDTTVMTAMRWTMVAMLPRTAAVDFDDTTVMTAMRWTMVAMIVGNCC